MKTKTQKIVISAMLAAFTAVLTLAIKIPSPIGGYINLGDALVLFSGWFMSPLYGFFAAGIGSALADILLGYAAYAPATFLIKGLMAVTAHFFFRLLQKKSKPLVSMLISGALAELVMILGYYLFEAVFFYGFMASTANIPANILQGIFSLFMGALITNALNKKNLSV